MSLTSLIVCADAEAVQVLDPILKDMGIRAEYCSDPAAAAAYLAEQRFDLLLIDCEDEQAAVDLIADARKSPGRRPTLAIAIVDGQNEVRGLFTKGADFLLYKPVSAERAANSLRAARSLIPERRRKPRIPISARASITYSTTEDAPAPLLNLSEDGVALHSESKMPPPCRVYFQFTLPGQGSVVRLSGEVVWQDSRGRVGLQFARVPKASRQVLDEWLRTNFPRRTQDNETVTLVLDSPGSHQTESQPIEAASQPVSSTERRAQARRACRLGVNVYPAGGSVLQQCAMTDMSAGGCYVETTQPLPVDTKVVIEVRTLDMKVRVRGEVQSMHRGYGMGIEFSMKTAEDRDQVKQLIDYQESEFQSRAPAATAEQS